MGAGIVVTELTFNDGSRIDCEGYDVILIVGPNNSGKTRSLMEINGQVTNRFRQQTSKGMIVSESRSVRQGTKNEAWDVIRSMGSRISSEPNESYTVNLPHSGGNNFSVTKDIMEYWEVKENFNHLEQLFVSYLGPDSRADMSNPQQSIDFGRVACFHPLHYLHEDRALRKRLADGFQRAFGLEIAIDLNAGPMLPLHVGKDASPKAEECEYGREYLDRLRSYPRINEQGHGIRSFAGILLHCWASHAKLVLIDEPEAFLHPPQARLLARLLVEKHEPGRQLILATHSTDIIRGVLECPDVRVKVIRLRREGDCNIARELSHEDIKEVWSDPVLRYSNILDGLFFERVVVCEADGDCRFYHAIADALRESEDHAYARDVMFTQAGGKGGIAKLVRALRKLEVPVMAVVDFDILRQQEDVTNLLFTLGDTEQSIASDYEIVKNDINKMGSVSISDTKKNIEVILASVSDSAKELPKSFARKIQNEIRPHIGWKRAKSNGTGMLGRGAAHQAGKNLLDTLATSGLLVVPCGELESFVPQETTEKNEWVSSVLEKYRGQFATAPELEDARKFVTKMIKPLE